MIGLPKNIITYFIRNNINQTYDIFNSINNNIIFNDINEQQENEENEKIIKYLDTYNRYIRSKN